MKLKLRTVAKSGSACTAWIYRERRLDPSQRAT